jgi:hypothetical protein
MPDSAPSASSSTPGHSPGLRVRVQGVGFGSHDSGLEIRGLRFGV